MKWLSGNQLKLLALFAMTSDHVAVQLLPQYGFLRIIGRLALPIFAYMIAEGCRYTKDRKRYLLTVLAVAAVCQAVYFVALRSLYQCILVTFALSICWIYALDYAKEKQTAGAVALAVAASGVICFLSMALPALLSGSTDFRIDYGIWGILLPVIIYFSPRPYKVPATALGLLPLCLVRGGIQWWSMAAVVLLAMYSGKRGKAPLKYLFYIYYPTHLAVIHLIRLLM